MAHDATIPFKEILLKEEVKGVAKRATFFCLAAWLLLAFGLSAVNGQAPAEPPAPQPSAAVQKILDEAEQLTKAKQPQEALKAADRALIAAREARDLVGEAMGQRPRARALQDLGRTQEAVAAWREAAAAWEQAGDGPGRIEALAGAGLLLAAQKSAEADALFAEALALGRAEAKRPRAAARWLNIMGSSFYSRRQLQQAREFFAAALALREKLAPNSLDVANSLNSLGVVAMQQGDLSTAKEYHQRALALREKQAPNSLDVAASLGNLGNVARQQGDLSSAKEYHQRALALYEKQAPNSLDVAASLNELGIVAGKQGDLSTAREYFQRALALREKQAPNSLDMALNLNNLGVVARQQGDLSAAREYYQRALALQEKQAPNSLYVAASLNNLGIVATQQGDLSAAREYHQRALALKEKQAPNSLDVALSLNNLGIVAWKQGDLSAAKGYHQRALALQEKQAPNSLDVALSLNNLGMVAWKQGDLSAKGYHQRALALKEKLAPNSLDVAASLNNLGMVVYEQGDLTEAERLARRAWALVRQQATAVTGDEARQAFGTSTAEYAAHLARYQLALGKVGPAFITAEEGRAQALQQLMVERQVVASATNRQQWSEYQAAVAARDRAEQAVSRASVAETLARRELATKQEERAAPDLIAKAQAALETAQKKFEQAQATYTQARVKADQLWADIKKNAPRAFTPPLTLEQAQQAVPTGTLFVAFSVGEEQTHLFLLRSVSPHASPLSAHTVSLTERELQTLVRALRREVTDPASGGQDVSAASRALFAKLFPKEAQVAIAEAQRLLISPDGPLWEVPFAALVTNAQGAPKYLGEDKAITYTQSLALFAQSRNDAPKLAKGGRVSALVVGNPIFDRKTTLVAAASPTEYGPRGERGYFFIDGKPPAPLPGTKKEAVEIAQLYGSVPLTEEQATEAALRERIDQADVIHLATHGYLHPVRAMSSGVLLTVPEKEPEVGETNNDGALQAWEIYSQLKLKAELVVLSACETGRGQNVQGEGIIGLTRALQYAGARSIIASQWRVADESTTRLMVALHRHLRKGLAKDEALRQAMVLLRKEKRTSHPYYWAPFFLTGDPDNPNLGAGGASK